MKTINYFSPKQCYDNDPNFFYEVKFIWSILNKDDNDHVYWTEIIKRFIK